MELQRLIVQICDLAHRARRLVGGLLIVIHCLTVASYGQPPRPTFELAVIKPVPVDSGVPGGMARVLLESSWEATESLRPPGMLPVQHGRLSVKERSLLSLVAAAYRVRKSQVLGPSWLADLDLNIEAKLSDGTSSQSANEALQCLLEDRFGLRLHREHRNMPGYFLVQGTNLRLKPAVEGTDVIEPERVASQMEAAKTRQMEAARKGVVTASRVEQRRHLPNTTTAVLADVVAQILHAPVVDSTSLLGRFDIDLEVMRGDSLDDRIESRVSDALASLGLRLKSAKVPVEVLIIDHIDRTPAPN